MNKDCMNKDANESSAPHAGMDAEMCPAICGHTGCELQRLIEEARTIRKLFSYNP
jgi:hypothetical protein